MTGPFTHPLMPGIRCAEINCTDWPRTLHDKQLTGFSPLALGMSRAPRQPPWRTWIVLSAAENSLSEFAMLITGL